MGKSGRGLAAAAPAGSGRRRFPRTGRPRKLPSSNVTGATHSLSGTEKKIFPGMDQRRRPKPQTLPVNAWIMINLKKVHYLSKILIKNASTDAEDIQ